MNGIKNKREWKLEFARRLNARIEYLRISHTELAKRSGLKQSQISSYVRGLHIPNTYTLCKLAHGLAMRPSDLIDF